MQLVNVPTKEWLESLEEEKNKATIKDAKNQYALTLFQNEDENTLKKECIEAIKSHEWFNDGVKDVDKETFIEDLNKLTKEGLFILARHTGAMQAELYCEGKSRYNIKENKVYTNLHTTHLTLSDNKALGYKLGMLTFLHEVGYWLDSNITGEKLGLTSKMEKLYNAIQKDVINFINKAGKELYKAEFTPLKDLSQASIDSLKPRIKQAVTNRIGANIHINSNVSDIYGAVTQNTIAGKDVNKMYGHDNDYWKYNEKSEYRIKVHAEFIAEAFESLCNKRRVNAMQEYLPTAWKEFNTVLKYISNRRK